MFTIQYKDYTMQEVTHMILHMLEEKCVTLLTHYPLCMPCQESVEGAKSEMVVLFFPAEQGL